MASIQERLTSVQSTVDSLSKSVEESVTRSTSSSDFIIPSAAQHHHHPPPPRPPHPSADGGTGSSDRVMSEEVIDLGSESISRGPTKLGSVGAAHHRGAPLAGGAGNLAG